MTKRPLFLAGCVYLVMTAVSFYALEAAIGLALLAVFLLLLQLWRKKNAKALLIGTAATILACLSVLSWQNRAEVQLELVGETQLLEGIVTDSRIYDSAVFYDVEVPMQGQDMKLSLWSYDMEAIAEGNRFAALVTFEEEDRRYWSDGGILTAEAQELQDLGMESGLRADCLRLRRKLQSRIESLFHGKSEEILLGLLLGEKAELSTEVEEVFLKSGSLHLLTVSGFHVSIMAAGLFAFFRMLQLNPKLCAALSLPFLLILLLLEGSTVSVLRAAIMTALVFLATMLERDYDGLSGWGLAVLIILLPEPLRMFSSSFVLSFSAVLGILIFAPILRREGSKLLALTQEKSLAYRLLSRIINIVVVSVAANLLTAPFLLYFFGNFPLLAPLSSLLIMPLLPLIMGTAVAAIAIPIPMLSSILAAVAQLFCAVLYRLLSMIASWDAVYYGENNLLLFGLLFFYVLLLLLFVFQIGKKRLLCMVLSYVLLLTATLGAQALLKPEATTLYAGRSSILLCRDGRAVFIGAVEKERDLDEVQRIFRSEGVETVDLCCLTDSDDWNETRLLKLIEQWKPEYIASAAVREALEMQGIEYSCNPQETVCFWDNWQLNFTKNGALLTNGERKFLKLHEKYAIMSMYRPEYTAILGDDGMIYGDDSESWSKSWSGAMKATLEDEHDSGTGKPAAGANQRG